MLLFRPVAANLGTVGPVNGPGYSDLSPRPHQRRVHPTIHQIAVAAG